MNVDFLESANTEEPALSHWNCCFSAKKISSFIFHQGIAMKITDIFFLVPCTFLYILADVKFVIPPYHNKLELSLIILFSLG